MIPRFQHILLPLDFTEKNQAALDVAFELAVANRAAVTLLHVIESIDLSDDEEIQEFYRQLEERAEGELELRSQRFTEAGLNVEWKIRYGKRAKEIVAFEREHDIDLIVMSSHPLDVEQPARSFATLSYQVAVLCRCPILLVKQ